MWENILVELLRGMLLDFKTPPKYTDDDLERLIISAAYFVIPEGGFTGSFNVNIDEATITPDPTTDPDFSRLIVLKSACMLDGAEARIAAGQAVDIRDGSSSISLRGVVGARLAILKEGWCKHYNKVLIEYLVSGTTASIGAAVLGPFGCGSEPARREDRYGRC